MILARRVWLPALGFAALLHVGLSEAEVAALRTTEGLLFVSTWSDGGCTVEAKGAQIKPVEGGGGFYWVDQRLLQPAGATEAALRTYRGSCTPKALTWAFRS